MSPAQVYGVHARVAKLAEALNLRALEQLKARWLPRPHEAAARHKALHQPTSASAVW